ILPRACASRQSTTRRTLARSAARHSDGSATAAGRALRATSRRAQGLHATRALQASGCGSARRAHGTSRLRPTARYAATGLSPRAEAASGPGSPGSASRSWRCECTEILEQAVRELVLARRPRRLERREQILLQLWRQLGALERVLHAPVEHVPDDLV